MVSFQLIQETIVGNPNATCNVSNIRILPVLPVDRYEIPKTAVETTKIPKKSSVVPVVPAVVPVTHSKDDSSDSEDSLPPPTRSIGKVQEIVPTNIPSDPVFTPAIPTVSSVIEKKEKEYSLPFHKGSVDPICIAIELQDAMYAIASPNVRLSLECEEARRLESLVDTLYKGESGRSRGWTKTKLTEFLVPRAAAGGKPKNAFDWSAIWTNKEASALLDFVCLAKGIRLAVWKSETEVGLWPAADKEGTKPTLIHVGITGVSLRDRNISNTRILAPYSVVAALEKLSLDELESVAQKMGVSLPSGKKAEKAAFLASARMRLRLV